MRDALAAVGRSARAIDLACCEAWFAYRLGPIYHVEHPMGVLRLARALTRALCVTESQTARVETPASFGFGTREAFEATDAVIAIDHEADQGHEPARVVRRGAVVLPQPDGAASHDQGGRIRRDQAREPGPEHDPDFHTGDRTILFAVPG